MCKFLVIAKEKLNRLFFLPGPDNVDNFGDNYSSTP
ncbi:hypothetical protein L1278_000273 [Pontibacter sp. HSC-36F09]|nr:hypothetical protein [Pontibacter sp. HSC-36F09]